MILSSWIHRIKVHCSLRHSGLLKNHNYLENNKFLYFERSKSDVREYDDFFKSTHIAIKDLSIGDVSYTILINKNL